jgi:inosine-uridine nucleoside N-ribohydrolase
MSRVCVLDCDPGTDDAIAILLALASPELDVQLVTVAGGNVGLEATLPNARALVGLAGRAVPVVAGAERPLLGAFTSETKVHGANGLGGVVLPEGPAAAPGVAADAIRALLREAPEAGVTLIGIGPATNLALALLPEPALASRVAEIVLMTGAWGEGNITPAAEFNAWSDPEALAVLFACGRPVTVASLDLTAQAMVTPGWVAELAALPGRCARAASDILARVPASPRMGGAGYPLHDPCAVAWLLAPALFGTRDCFAEVELAGASRGRTNLDRFGKSGRAANIRNLETLDAFGLFSMLKGRIGGLP